jgi:hypothetical protein
MQILSLVWGILAFLGMIVGFLPCLGAINWLNIPFAGVGLIISIAALATSKTPNNGAAIAGLLCNGIAIIIGVIRLTLGGGIL